MKVREVFILEDAISDLEIGRDFYDEQEQGVGEYFTAALLSDINDHIARIVAILDMRQNPKSIKERLHSK